MAETINFDSFLKAWEELLNTDDGLKSRLKPWRTFIGGPTPYPGPGPYPPPNLLYDPSGWTKAKGYKSSILDGKELVEIIVPSKFTFTIKVDKGIFSVKKEKARDPCLSVKMTLQTFKDLMTAKDRVIWCLTDPENEVSYKEGIALSDWTTIFETLVVGQELLERKFQFWEFIEKL